MTLMSANLKASIQFFLIEGNLKEHLQKIAIEED